MIRSPLLLGILAFFVGSSAFAASDRLILTGRAADLAKLKTLIAKRYQIGTVFTDPERALLRSYGKADLAEASVVSAKALSTVDALNDLGKKIRRNRLSVKVEMDMKVTPFQTGTDPYIKDLWAIKNTGALQRMFITNFESISIPGVVGEDVNVLGTSTREGKGITVAVLDSGVDVNHPDLSPNIRRKDSECANLARYKTCVANAESNGDPVSLCDKDFMKLDADKNGYPMDCEGWSFIGKKNPVSGQFGGPLVREQIPDSADGVDSTGHGTKVAGIIAAVADNSLGIRGIAPQAKILPIQVTTEKPGTGGGSVGDEETAANLISTVVRGMLYAIAEKADVANLSLGWNGRADSQLMRDAVKLAQEKGMLVVSAAGNDSTDALVYPCQYDGVICVGAHDPDGKMSEFSNFGSGVDIAAPGFAILSTVQDDVDPVYFTDAQGYDFDRGTSFASPFVAGAAAILRSQGYSAQETAARLLVGARRKPYSEGKITLTGNLDVKGALSAKPQPFFTPVNKGVYPTLWDRKTNQADLEIDLKNIWAAAGKTTVRLTLSERDRKLGQISLSKSSFSVASWKAGETKTLPLHLHILDLKVTSDATLRLEIQAAGTTPQTIRVPLQISVVLDEKAALPNAKVLPISGSISADAAIFTVTALDGRPEKDYVAMEPGDSSQWKIQMIRERIANGKSTYVAGPVKTITLPDGASPRITQRIDVNLDGKSEYVFTTYVPNPNSDDNGGIPFFRFDYRDENGNDVLPSYTFANKTTVLQLDNFQWIRSGNRLVPAWTDAGKTPDAEKSTKYDPWNPNPSDDETPRLYYHDEKTTDGVRSVSMDHAPADLPKGLLFLGLLNQSAADRRAGKVTAILSEQGDYVSKFYVAEIDEASSNFKTFPLEVPSYRNLRSLDSIKTYVLDPSGSLTAAGSSFSGISGTQNQRVSAIVKASGKYLLLEQRLSPPLASDTVYKTIASFVEGPTAAPTGISVYGQASYEILYKDPTTDRTLLTSLRRYTFLSASLFERSFANAVAESGGERLGAIQIPDGFGAYPGAEVIAPLRRNGVSIDLIRPAALRIQTADDQCEWLARSEPSDTSPSEAVYYCGDHFVRIPYRF